MVPRSNERRSEQHETSTIAILSFGFFKKCAALAGQAQFELACQDPFMFCAQSRRMKDELIPMCAHLRGWHDRQQLTKPPSHQQSQLCGACPTAIIAPRFSGIRCFATQLLLLLSGAFSPVWRHWVLLLQLPQLWGFWVALRPVRESENTAMKVWMSCSFLPRFKGHFYAAAAVRQLRLTSGQEKPTPRLCFQFFSPHPSRLKPKAGCCMKWARKPGISKPEQKKLIPCHLL